MTPERPQKPYHVTLEGWLRRFGILTVNGSEPVADCEHVWWTIRHNGMSVAVRCSFCFTDPLLATLGGTVYRARHPRTSVVEGGSR